MAGPASAVTLAGAQASARQLVEDADRLDRQLDELERTVEARLGRRQERSDLEDVEVWATCMRRDLDAVEAYITQTKEKHGWHD